MTFTLPTQLRLFPLNGSVLLPGELLPLNIFEPRYLNMIDDARADDDLIGMIQTRPGSPSPENPGLQAVGCAGRITSWNETPDGRYLIELEGVCRFDIIDELDPAKPYRTARVAFSRYAHDCDAPDALLNVDRNRLNGLLRLWFAQEQVETDWAAIDAAPMPHLINRMTMAAPFSPGERQSLLEAEDARKRLDIMSHILERRIAQSASGNPN